jgi:hypothetical protein
MILFCWSFIEDSALSLLKISMKILDFKGALKGIGKYPFNASRANAN